MPHRCPISLKIRDIYGASTEEHRDMVVLRRWYPYVFGNDGLPLKGGYEVKCKRNIQFDLKWMPATRRHLLFSIVSPWDVDHEVEPS